ncbi:cytochrome c [Flavobacterium jejuense]|uniref:Cytochrome c n=1 Tax=Flavobacterium jejuense TaxID=1544455 RepID=A0ABX0J1S3_9FLAO|nr:cytochrome c [Flavobacterium jejuense]NHN27924.1 cytochrome c [Flavobacterium jejuense]
MKLKIAIGLILSLFFVACSSSKKNVVEAIEIKEVEQVHLQPELAQGKVLYENNCGKCHTLHSADKYSKEQWSPIVLRMQKKARVNDEQRELIYNYLVMNK